MRCVFPPHGGRSAVEVVADDLNRLEVEEFLNDTIIDFYIK
jgi:sentrin-specific protease 7